MNVPETDEVKYKIGDALDIAGVKAYVDPDNVGDKRIIVLKYNFEEPYEPDEDIWTRIVIMDRVDIFNSRDYEDGSVSHEVYVRTDTVDPMDPDVDFDGSAFLQRLHSKIYEVLNGKVFTLDRAVMSMPLYRVRRPVMTRKNDRGFLYNGSIYKTVLTSYE